MMPVEVPDGMEQMHRILDHGRYAEIPR
jgi:hypothetical protein